MCQWGDGRQGVEETVSEDQKVRVEKLNMDIRWQSPHGTGSRTLD